MRIIRVDRYGTVRALHYDDMDLGFLGPKQIGRASEIMFNDQTQSFYVEFPQLKDGARQPGFVCGFKGYDDARAFEVMLLETCAKNHVNPAYEGGFYRLANETRARFDGGDRQVFAWNGNTVAGSCPV